MFVGSTTGQSSMSKKTSEIRSAAFARSRNFCECGCRRYITEESGRLDHFFGRAKAAQSIENCWALHLLCDVQKTHNQPKASLWLEKFIAHCQRYGYAKEEERALAKLQALVAKGRA